MSRSDMPDAQRTADLRSRSRRDLAIAKNCGGSAASRAPAAAPQQRRLLAVAAAPSDQQAGKVVGHVLEDQHGRALAGRERGAVMSDRAAMVQHGVADPEIGRDAAA